MEQVIAYTLLLSILALGSAVMTYPALGLWVALVPSAVGVGKAWAKGQSGDERGFLRSIGWLIGVLIATSMFPHRMRSHNPGLMEGLTIWALC